MGAVGGLLGLGGGAAGTDFAPPQNADLLTPVSAAQLKNSADYSSQTMQAQQNLLGQLQAQGGLGNQSNVYNQLQQIGTGTGGPNPAQAQYNANVQQLAAQQAGAIGSIRGINPALQAQLIAQQGSMAKQNAAAAGQANLANQQLGALSAAGNLANTMATNQIGQTNANTQAAQGQEGMYQQAASNLDTSRVSQQNSINTANASMANTQMQGQQSMLGGIGSFAGKAAGMIGPAAALAAANGGEVRRMADGGAMAPADAAFGAPGGPSKFGQFVKSSLTPAAASGATDAAAVPQTPQQTLHQGAYDFANGIYTALGGGGGPPSAGQQLAGMGPEAGPDMASPDTMYAARGGMTHDYRSGGNVKAKSTKEKAVKSGNSYANDKIPAVLSEGEVVIPRSVMQSGNPPAEAMKFVQAVMAKRGKK
jgi:hypothetical protein